MGTHALHQACLLVGGVGEGEGLALFAASSAAFAASLAFELAFLGAITGGFFVAQTVGAKCWNLLTNNVQPDSQNIALNTNEPLTEKEATKFAQKLEQIKIGRAHV